MQNRNNLSAKRGEGETKQIKTHKEHAPDYCCPPFLPKNVKIRTFLMIRDGFMDISL